MPKDANDALDPSSDATLDAATDTVETVEGADSAASSDAHGATEDEGLLSVVRDVVDPKTEDPASTAASPAEGDEDGQTTDEDPDSKEPDNEDFSDVPFHKHPRFQQLLQTAKSNKADAEQYRNIQGFMDQSGLSPEETADGLIIMGLAKTDPAAAWKAIQPWVTTLLHAAGEVLPEDLAARVQAGEMTRDAAQEVSRLRAQAKANEAKQTFDQQQSERRQQTEQVNALVGEAVKWEQARQTRDPNFAAKLEPLKKELAYLQVVEGKPTTPEGVRDQLNRAYKAVNDAPPAVALPTTDRPAKRPITGGSVSGTTRPEPTSLLDVVRANRASAA